MCVSIKRYNLGYLGKFWMVEGPTIQRRKRECSNGGQSFSAPLLSLLRKDELSSCASANLNSMSRKGKG